MYPRRGVSLVPAKLRPVLARVNLSPALAGKQRGFETLADLTAETWEHYTHPEIERLAAAVVVAVRRRWSWVGALEVRAVPAGILIDELDLARRTMNSLYSSGAGRSDGLRGLRISDLCKLPNFGAVGILDLLSGVEEKLGSQLPLDEERPVPLSGRQAAVANDVVAADWSAAIFLSDVRFGRLVGALSPTAQSARDAARHVCEGRLVGGSVAARMASLEALAAAAEEAQGLTLRQELAAVVNAAHPRDRARLMTMQRLGFSGPARTLADVGEEHNVTRERVRQLEGQFRKAVDTAQSQWLPVLDRTLQELRKVHVVGEQEMTDHLVASDLLDTTTPLSTVFSAARVFHRAVALIWDADLGVAYDATFPEPKIVVRAARELITHWGVATLEDLADRCDGSSETGLPPAYLRAALSGAPDLGWLDREKRWFWLCENARNRLLNQIEKILAVAGSVTVSDLRDGVGRHHRMEGFRPPAAVLAELCRQLGYGVDGDRVFGGDDLPDWRELLGGVERRLCEILMDNGSVMRRKDLERVAVDEAGINRSSFYVYLGYSPLITRFAPSIYGLRGAPITAAEIQALVPPREKGKVLQDHGWLPDGRLWVVYRLSAASCASGVLNVPSALKPLVSSSYPLSDRRGELVGTLGVRDGAIWGFSPFFRREGAEAGDYLALLLNLESQQGEVALGSSEILIGLQAAEWPNVEAREADAGLSDEVLGA